MPCCRCASVVLVSPAESLLALTLLFLIIGVAAMQWLVGDAVVCSLSQCCFDSGSCFAINAAAMSVPGNTVDATVPAFLARLFLGVAITLVAACMATSLASTLTRLPAASGRVAVLLAAGGSGTALLGVLFGGVTYNRLMYGENDLTWTAGGATLGASFYLSLLSVCQAAAAVAG